MGTIATLAERALAKASSGLGRIVPDDPDKAEWVGEKIKGIVGQKVFDKIERFADDASDERYDRRQKKTEASDYARDKPRPVRERTRDDRLGGWSL